MNNHESDNKTNEKAVSQRTVLIFAVCIGAILALSQISPLMNLFGWVVDTLSPIFLGVILAYIINPLTRIMEDGLYSAFEKVKEARRKKLSHGLAVALSLVILIAIIALLLFLIIPEFLDSLERLVAKAPALFDNALKWLDTYSSADNVFFRNFSQYIDSAIVAFTSWIGGEFSTAVTGLFESLISVVTFFFDFIVAIVVFVYALLEKHKFVAQSKKIVFALFKPDRANDILAVARYGNEVFGKFVLGKLITSTIVGVLTFVFMKLMGMPYALLSAGIIAITNVIPFFGPFIGGIPTAFIVLITDVKQGLIYIVFLVILQQLEGNIIEPLIMEDTTGVSKFWITFALLICGGVFGIAGMIFSVPLFAVLFYCIRMYVERSLIRKGLPVSSDAYLDVVSLDIQANTLCPSPQHPPRKKLIDAIRNRHKPTGFAPAEHEQDDKTPDDTTPEQ